MTENEAPIEDDPDFEGERLEVDIGFTDVGDLDAYCAEEDMQNDTDNHDRIYNQSAVSDSDDDGPEEEVDEEGFTVKEAALFKKITGRDKTTSLFRDLSLSDGAVVDGGTRLVLGARPSSLRDKKASK